MELRWVLLGFGALIIVAVYLWGKGLFRFGEPKSDRLVRQEPKIEVDDSGADLEPATMAAESTVKPEGPVPVARKPTQRAPEKVVALRLMPRAKAQTGEKTVLALRRVGLEHGRFGIFHRVVDEGGKDAIFSVANLTPPGTFDLTKLSESEIPGLSVFMVLPGRGDPVDRFDAMLETARSLAHELNLELFDEKGSSWSVQRERYLREEMIQYKHRLEHR